MMAEMEKAAAEWVIACDGRRQAAERIKPGLYRVHWQTGGSSLAAIGCGYNGDNWIAPTNWLRPSTIPFLEARGDWGGIARLEPLEQNGT